jgi:hypothetical protein
MATRKKGRTKNPTPKKGSKHKPTRKKGRKQKTVGTSPAPKSTGVPMRTFAEWRTDPSDRDEDAAYAFGNHLIVHCRDEALKKIPTRSTDATRACAVDAVDTALHNVCDMLEGYWRLDIDPTHAIELALQVRVRDESDEVVETREISPCMLDLPLGYWKWARDREFR